MIQVTKEKWTGWSYKDKSYFREREICIDPNGCTPEQLIKVLSKVNKETKIWMSEDSDNPCLCVYEIEHRKSTPEEEADQIKKSQAYAESIQKNKKFTKEIINRSLVKRRLEEEFKSLSIRGLGILKSIEAFKESEVDEINALADKLDEIQRRREEIKVLLKGK